MPDQTPSRGDAALERVLAAIRRLGLETNLVELETQGYTTLPGILSEEQIDRASKAVLARVESGAALEGTRYIPYLLYDDEVFEQILIEPKPLALITYLLGESCLLSSLGSHVKAQGGMALLLHSDNGNGMPGPFPAFSQVANVNYALTPYSREEGALALVPGSHKLARQPRREEMLLGPEVTNRRAVALDLSPGDAVVWHGNTWHGSFERTVPGMRMNLAVYFNRQYLRTQERHGDPIPEELLARHAQDERFKTLLGAKQPYGWQREGPDNAIMARNPRGLYD